MVDDDYKWLDFSFSPDLRMSLGEVARDYFGGTKREPTNAVERVSKWVPCAPKQRQTKRGGPRTCKQCGQPGHYSVTCKT